MTMQSIVVRVLFGCLSIQAGCCLFGSQGTGPAPLQAPIKRTEISKLVHLSVELEDKPSPTRAFIRFENKSQASLWFPAVEIPSYRLEPESKAVWVWVGYFDEPMGQLRMHYMVPHLQEVKPGEEFKLEVTWPELVQGLYLRRSGLHLLARVATKDFVYTNVRGEQPLDDYIKNSIVVESTTVVKK